MEKSKVVDFHDVLCWIKVLSFYSGRKQNQAKKGVTRLFEKPTMTAAITIVKIHVLM